MIIFAEESIINWQTIVAFILGLVAGMTILFSLFLIFISRSKKEEKKVYVPTMDELSEEKVRELIKNKQKDFIKAVEEDDIDYFKACSSLTMELLHEISSYYYPESKYPEYELTITEAAELIHYITDQIVKVFDKPIINHFKNSKISTIVSRIEKGNKIKNSKLGKATSKGAEVFQETKAITNTINPVYWFRKIFVQGSVNIALKKICKSELSIAGREFNKVYSKNLFKNPDADEKTQKNINEDIEEIFNDEV